MAKSPAFQFYVQDFLYGTRFFTTEEIGAYLLLLCEQWDKGFIADDPAVLRKITGISLKKLQKVLEKFEKNENGLINIRLENERKKKSEYSSQQSDRAKKRWGKSDASAMPVDMPRHNSGNALHLHTSTSSSKEDIGEQGSQQAQKDNSEIIKKKQKQFADALVPFIPEFSKETIRAFYDYWSEPNRSLTKMKWELERTWDIKRRLTKWKENEGKFSNKPAQQEIQHNSFLKPI